MNRKKALRNTRNLKTFFFLRPKFANLLSTLLIVSVVCDTNAEVIDPLFIQRRSFQEKGIDYLSITISNVGRRLANFGLKKTPEK